ncbi:hypothetical protein LIER_29989 [Lithospermum erythrorhizon]|uniref:Uncharacterized protein n=1 Tax=Lithospermum erythrorhizon TaxID=34254 RepID=A0AAV3RRA8_LITER
MGNGYLRVCLLVPSPALASPFPLTILPLKFFDLQGVVLQSYRRLLSSYEEDSGSSSQVGQLEHELKAREEVVLQCHLKNLAGDPAEEICQQHPPHRGR